MTLRFDKTYRIAATLVACLGISVTALANDTFVVSSKVVSDTAAPAASYVGDLDGSVMTTGCSTCGDCSTGDCLGGDCGKKGCLSGLLGKRNGDCGCTSCQPRKYDQPDLFYNFYSGGNCNSANAQMYISPQPVPHFVGHTFYTYQPFYPHEYMYWHKNRYHNVYDNGRGMNRTRAAYYAPPVKTAVSNLYWNKLRLPR